MASKSSIFPCNTCSITFNTSELQRSHMRQPWHVHNLRRRVAELPALSEEQYDTHAKGQEIIRPQALSDEEEPEQRQISANMPKAECRIPEKIPPTQCLFCNVESPTLDANVDHMSSLHGLFIPSPDQLSDMEAFLGYLAIVIFEYNECLYCGLEKSTVDGVQTHMRDKGHCMIRMTAESELLDFWGLSDSDDEGQNEDDERRTNAAIKLSETEMRLPSGVVIGSRSDTAQLRAKPGLAQSRTNGSQYRLKRAEMRTITAGENQETAEEKESRPSRTHDRRVVIRGEMGLAGIPESQRRALQLTEKKMKRREAVAKAAQRYAAEHEPIKAKYYKTEAPIYQAG